MTCGPRMMSDMGDMTMEMMRRLQSSMDQLSQQDLAKLKALCSEVSAKADALSKGSKPAPIAKQAAPPAPAPAPAPVSKPRAFVIGSSNADVVAENDKFFGIDEGPIDESGEPIKKKAPQEKNKIPQPQLKNLKEEPTEGTRRFSKYLPDERPANEPKSLPTDEAVVDAGEWNKEYEKIFGKPDNLPISDIDELTSPKGGTEDPNDSFAKVRAVQANARNFNSPDEYYKALNAAMNEWRLNRQAKGNLVGSVTSDRYIDQLANAAPDAANRQEWGQAKKFTLDAMLNPVSAKDEDGKDVTVLQFTQVDDFGTCGLAGVQVGEALTQLNNRNINSFDDLKAAIGEIHAAGLSKVQGTVQGRNGPRTVDLKGA